MQILYTLRDFIRHCPNLRSSLFFQMTETRQVSVIGDLSLNVAAGFVCRAELRTSHKFNLTVQVALKKKKPKPSSIKLSLRASPLLTDAEWVQLAQQALDFLVQYKNDNPIAFEALTVETAKELLFGAEILDRTWYDERKGIFIERARKILLDEELDIEAIAATAQSAIANSVDPALMNSFRMVQGNRAFYTQHYLNNGLPSAIDKARRFIEPYADAALSLLLDENTTVEDMNAFGKRNLALFGGKSLGMNVNLELNFENFDQEVDIILSIGAQKKGGGGKSGFTTFSENANLPTKMFHLLLTALDRNKLFSCPFALSVKVDEILTYGNRGRGRLWLAKGKDLNEICADDIEEEFKRDGSLYDYYCQYRTNYL